MDEPFCKEVPLVETVQAVVSSAGKCDGDVVNNLEKISVGHAWPEQGAIIGLVDNFIRKVLAGLSQKYLPALPFYSENVSDDT